MRDLVASPDRELKLGGSLQIRKAVIGYTAVDGSWRNVKRNIGPVPLLKARLRLPAGETTWWRAEVDGIYAPIKYFNGSDNDVVGSLLHASLHAGLGLGRGTAAFLNLRYLGASGTSHDPGSDGYSANWLGSVPLSLGATVR